MKKIQDFIITKTKNYLDIIYIGGIPKDLEQMAEKLINLITSHFSINKRINGELIVEKSQRNNRYRINDLNKVFFFL